MSNKVCNFAPANQTYGQMPSFFGSGFSAVGSAHVWGARGRWFESSNPDQIEKELDFPTPFLFFTFTYLYSVPL